MKIAAFICIFVAILFLREWIEDALLFIFDFVVDILSFLLYWCLWIGGGFCLAYYIYTLL